MKGKISLKNNSRYTSLQVRSVSRSFTPPDNYRDNHKKTRIDVFNNCKQCFNNYILSNELI